MALSVAVAAQQAPPTQQTPPPGQQPTFRSGVQTVAVPTSVFDQFGEVVSTLGRDDFLVFDDGRRQELTNFESGQQPITALVLLDTSASMIARLDLAKLAAEQFIVRLWPGDKARVGSFSDRIQLLGNFTADRDALLRTLRNDLHVGNPTRMLDAIGEGMAELAPLAGRRVLIVFTDGCDTDSKLSYDTLLARLPAEEFMVYAVQIGGAPPIANSRVQVNPYGFRGMSGSQGCSGRAHEFELSVMQAESLRSFLTIGDPRRVLTGGQVLSRLTSETGGGHFSLSDRDDINTTFTKVMFELHHQYLLGFSPRTLDGKKHVITVRVGDMSMQVRARKAYIAKGTQ